MGRQQCATLLRHQQIRCDCRACQQIGREADILDKLGASAITDSLLMLGKRDLLGFQARRELAEGRAMQRASFFKDYIWTGTGKRLAEQRFSFFLHFLEQLAEEVVETSDPLEEVNR